MKKHEFTPKLFTLLQEGVTKKQLLKDILAGVIVGIVALPLTIAFAILGGSRVQICGLTGTFIVTINAKASWV